METETYLKAKADLCREHDYIDPALYGKYNVKRGLRDLNGNGVLAGLTNISQITASEMVNGVQEPRDGKLWYRGYLINTLVDGLGDDLGYEKIAYLLLMGELPDEAEEKAFKELIGASRDLKPNFVRDVIMKAPTQDVMNTMTRSILTLASYDDNCADISLENVLRQSIQLIAQFPLLAVYSYHAYNSYVNGESMYIHKPDPELSTAENLLKLLRPDQSYTPFEAKVLDTALILHMEHGGGNNSSFTTRVVSSSGADTYSVIAAAMCSLKGPRHGGANIKTMAMMDDIRAHVSDYADKEEVGAYLTKILDKEAFDHQGLIYGMGHAVYSLSDPRERIFKGFVQQLAKEKGREQEMTLYQNVEDEATRLIASKRRIYKGVSANIDFYSGFVYDMLGIPRELYTAIFACARIVGWSAHRIEELNSQSKIIRPAYKSIMERREE
ncbi:MAG: citrate/2-methylcitrate synthase [Lachnospiraceae bacterium]|nr:citrate/2-methylcitrate synthase [Lachnospiraceae bacterium]